MRSRIIKLSCQASGYICGVSEEVAQCHQDKALSELKDGCAV